MKIVVSTLCFLLYLNMCVSWRAMPANQAMYAERSQDEGWYEQQQRLDEQLPRDHLDQLYKFGWCTIDVIQKNFFRKAVNVSLPTYKDTQLDFIYLIEKKHTQSNLQCIVMKAYVPEKFLYVKGRIPLYYCQGVLSILMFNTINRYEIHEFYLGSKLNIPMNFVFEFYHPSIL